MVNQDNMLAGNGFAQPTAYAEVLNRKDDRAITPPERAVAIHGDTKKTPPGVGYQHIDTMAINLPTTSWLALNYHSLLQSSTNQILSQVTNYPVANEDNSLVHQTTATSLPTKSLQMRSPIEIAKYRQIKMESQHIFFPHDLPMGPWVTSQIAFEAMQSYCQDKSTGGGGFGLIQKRYTYQGKENGSLGTRRFFQCECSGKYKTSSTGLRAAAATSKKTDCKWGVWVEQSTEGWIPSICSLSKLKMNDNIGTESFDSHNHSLAATVLDVKKSAKLRGIHDEIATFCNTLHEARIRPSKIYYSALEKCDKLGIAPTFVLADIQNKYSLNSSEDWLDSSQLIQYLQDVSNQDKNRQFAWGLSEDAVLDRIFYVLPNGITCWEKSKKVCLFDTKHGTNRYGYKLGTFSTVDNNGRTKMLAACIIASEDEEHFQWAFHQFEKLLHGSPEVIFTDSDKAIKNAIAASWCSTTHLLCTFHLYKNFYEQCHKHFIGNNEKWKVLANKWWRLCKKSDCLYESKGVFYQEWDSLSDEIVAACGQASVGLQKKKWLDGMKSRAPQWAACFTWKYRTYGVHSTQKAESVHGVIADRFASKKNSFVELIKDQERMSIEQDFRSEMSHSKGEAKDQFYDSLRGHFIATGVGAMAAVYEPAKLYCKHLSPFARHLCATQAQSLVCFKCSIIPGSNCVYHTQRFLMDNNLPGGANFNNNSAQFSMDFGLVHGEFTLDEFGHVTTTGNCSCQFYNCYGLPCGHMWAVEFQTNSGEVRMCP
jgi:hypothetical protein